MPVVDNSGGRASGVLVLVWLYARVSSHFWPNHRHAKPSYRRDNSSKTVLIPSRLQFLLAFLRIRIFKEFLFKEDFQFSTWLRDAQEITEVRRNTVEPRVIARAKLMRPPLYSLFPVVCLFAANAKAKRKRQERKSEERDNEYVRSLVNSRLYCKCHLILASTKAHSATVSKLSKKLF